MRKRRADQLTIVHTSRADQAGCGKTIVARWKYNGPRMAQQENAPAGCSKRPDFSPAQPWRAETRLVPGKAAAPRLTLVSRFTAAGSGARTKLAGFFSILIRPVRPALRAASHWSLHQRPPRPHLPQVHSERRIRQNSAAQKPRPPTTLLLRSARGPARTRRVL